MKFQWNRTTAKGVSLNGLLLNLNLLTIDYIIRLAILRITQ